MYQHAGAGSAEPFSDHAANPAGRAGDENGLILKFHVQSLLMLL